MNESLGRVRVQLAEREETVIPPDLIELLNTNIRPPKPVTESEVYVRSMYVVSDQVNSFGGRFPIEEFERLTQLLIDSPVLVGHRKDKLPIARNFHAVQTEREGRPWVRSYFFWMRGAEGADTLRDNIDGGIYKECSIGFTFLLPQCSVCGQDIRTCEHLPLHEYPGADGNSATCHFDYRQIDKVLETSLVYRGATPHTAVTKVLAAEAVPISGAAIEIGEPSAIEGAGPFLVMPCYEGVPVMASIQGGRLRMTERNGGDLPPEVCGSFPTSGLAETDPVAGLLVGYRGKERCPEDSVRRFVHEGSGPVTRLALHLVPRLAGEALAAGDDRSRYSVRTMRHRLVTRDGLADAVRCLATRNGARIVALSSPVQPEEKRVYRIRPAATKKESEYTLAVAPGSPLARLSVQHGGERCEYQLQQFDLRRWQQGRRFIADRMGEAEEIRQRERRLFREESPEEPQREGAGMTMALRGTETSRLVVRPILLDGRSRFLCYLRGVGGSI